MDWLKLRPRILKVRHSDQEGTLALQELLPVMQDLGTLMEGAIQQLSDEFLFLMEAQSLMPRVHQAVLRARNIPEDFEAFGMLLLSHCLREIRKECESGPTGDASWHTFRVRFNALPKEERTKILEVLPESDVTPLIPNTSGSLPDADWIATWNTLCEGIPDSCFPVAWRRLLPESVAEEIETPISADLSSDRILDVPHMILSRERERRERRPLGTWLFRLASLKELQNPTAQSKELVLPDWVVPQSSQVFLNELQGITSRLGGVPGDGQLRELLEQVRRSSSMADLSELRSSTAQILQMSSDWNARNVHVEGVAGITHLRSGRVEEARMAYLRMFNQAQSKQDAAMALANLAGLAAGAPEGFQESESLLVEALKLNPWSKLALRGFEILRSMDDSSVRRTGNE